MYFAPFIKPLLVVGTVGGTLATGSSLAIYKGVSGNVQSNNTIKEDGELVETNSLIGAPILTQAEKHSFAVLVQDTSALNRLEPENNKHRIKCKFEGGTRDEWCSLAKVTKSTKANKNWIDLDELKTNGFNGLIPNDYISKESTIYRVRFSEDLSLEWLRDTNKKLNIYKEDQITADTKPLISLVPKFALKTNNKIRGPVKYMLVKATNVNKAPTGNGATNIKQGESFKCAMPLKQPNNTLTYKVCEIYKFDQEQTTVEEFKNKNLKLPFAKADRFENNSHYLLKLNEPESVNHSSYDGEKLEIKALVYGGAEKDTVATTGITDINFELVSATFVFERNGSIDLVVIPK